MRFIPREVYTVSLVTPAAANKPQPKPAVQKVEPEPTPPKPEPAEEKHEEMPAPPERPKPKPPKKQVKKAVPSTDIKKTLPRETPAATPDDDVEPVATGDIALDGQDFPFAYYLATMKRKIAAYWEVPGSGVETQFCRVYFRVASNGSIVSPSVETSSGNFLFDQAALRAVVQASPLPPLPDGFTDDYLGVHFSFAYERE